MTLDNMQISIIRNTLIANMLQFEKYARLHNEKGTNEGKEKARVNQHMAEKTAHAIAIIDNNT